MGESENGRQLDLSTATLDPADAGRMNVRLPGEIVLRHVLPLTDRTDSTAECSARCNGVLVERDGHAEGSVAAPDRLAKSVLVGSALVQGVRAW